MCFVPVDFNFANRTIREVNGSFTLHLSPVASTIQPRQTPTITKARPSRDRRFYRGDLPYDLEGQTSEDYLSLSAVRDE